MGGVRWKVWDGVGKAGLNQDNSRREQGPFFNHEGYGKSGGRNFRTYGGG
jgi:hypothetical protein